MFKVYLYLCGLLNKPYSLMIVSKNNHDTFPKKIHQCRTAYLKLFKRTLQVQYLGTGFSDRPHHTLEGGTPQGVHVPCSLHDVSGSQGCVCRKHWPQRNGYNLFQSVSRGLKVALFCVGNVTGKNFLKQTPYLCYTTFRMIEVVKIVKYVFISF